jgi:hypothetical protein
MVLRQTNSLLRVKALLTILLSSPVAAVEAEEIKVQAVPTITMATV